MSVFVPAPHLLESPRHREWPKHSREPGTRDDSPPGTADVVIIGAGPAGLSIASALWHRGVRDVVLLDRAAEVCGRFFGRVDLLGQRVLRSPYEHHPGVEGHRDCELMDFARLHWSWLTSVERREIRMAQAGQRSVVPVDVFEAYCRHVAASHGIRERTWRADVHEVRPTRGGAVVRTVDTEIEARSVVLCLGEERQHAPAMWWAGQHPPPGVSYWDEPVPNGAGPLVVVGAGLTAAHLIGQALAEGRRVEWVLRESAERYQCSDVNASYFRTEGRARFDGVAWEERLELMRRHRRASVMFEFRPLLAEAEADGRLRVHRGRAVRNVSSNLVTLSDGTRVIGEHIVLALGTTPSIGEGLLPAELVAERDGWPDLDERTLAYRAAPNLFAVGAAACMVLGPAARNIDGHRVATARVAATVAARLSGAEGLLDELAGSEAGLARQR